MTTTSTSATSAGPTLQEGVLVRIAIGFTAWAERWFPDAFIFVAIAVVVVALAALINGASPVAVSVAFGNGFWSLITFTMQMAFVAIGGYVVATSAPAQRLIRWLADIAQNRHRCSRARRGGQHIGLSAQLGSEPDFRRTSGARSRGAARIAHGLPGRSGGGISGPWRDLGDGAVFVGSPATGKCCEPAQEPFTHHWRHSVLRDDLPVAIGRDHGRASCGFGHHRGLVGAGPNTAITAEAMGIEASREDAIDVRRRSSPGNGWSIRPF